MRRAKKSYEKKFPHNKCDIPQKVWDHNYIKLHVTTITSKGPFINDVVSRGKVELHMGTPLNYELVNNPRVGQKDNLGERGSILAQF